MNLSPVSLAIQLQLLLLISNVKRLTLMTHQPQPPAQHKQHASPRRRRFTLRLWQFCILCLLLIPTQAFAEEQTTVIFPELPSPYNKIFAAILQGIENGTEGTVHRYPLKNNFVLEDLQQSLEKTHSDGIISLGKKAAMISKELPGNQPVVVGALSIVPNGISGVSLSADPTIVFRRLKSLAPKIERIFVVYSEKNNGWLIEPARQAAKEHGIKLVAYRAADLRESMHHYRTLITNSNANSDAVWLPLDPVTVNDDVVLPLLLQAAWDKELMLVSNKPGHAKRGVLFAFYPYNYGLGQQLVRLLEQLKTEPQKPIVEPLKELKMAINLRTAAHLGMDFSPQQLKEFTLTFPSR